MHYLVRHKSKEVVLVKTTECHLTMNYGCEGQKELLRHSAI
jgi:hypothetical protein